MTLHHGDYCSLYDHNGKFELRGHIVGIHRTSPPYYDLQPAKEFSMASRINGIPAARIRKHFVAPHMANNDAKHIRDDA